MESALEPGSATEAAAYHKGARYSEVSERYSFHPLAVETPGVLGPSSGKFLGQLGQRITSVNWGKIGVNWSGGYSEFVARGNAVSILATESALQAIVYV